MLTLRIGQRLQGVLPNWLRATPACSSTSIEDALSVTGATTLIESVSTPFMFSSRTRMLTSASLPEERGEESSWEALDDIGQDASTQFEISDDFSSPHTVLNLPQSLEEIGRLNPDLREAMEAHASFAKSGPTNSPRQELETILIAANDGKPTNVTKSSLARLRVDQLRSALENFSADTRGNKPALIKRLLDLVSSTEASETATSVASELGSGVISNKKMARAAKMRARTGLTYGDVGVTEAELRKSQQAVVTDATKFSKVFSSPHDLARLLVEARADDIAIIDVRGHCTFTDYMVLATGRSPQLVHMLAQAVLYELKQRCKEVAPGVAPGIEGAEDANPQWLVVDSGSIVVHIFAEGARKEYDLESLWGTVNNITRVAVPKRKIETLATIRA